MTEIKRHTIRASGIRRYYMEAGEGAPAVLLHGFPETSYAWRHQMPELARKYRVVAPDLRGYGETDKPATGYDKRNIANDPRELMRSLEIPKIGVRRSRYGEPISMRWGKCSICQRSGRNWRRTSSLPKYSSAGTFPRKRAARDRQQVAHGLP
jgi:haloacetate dehalogenase